jgi:hypothetical protein
MRSASATSIAAGRVKLVPAASARVAASTTGA